MEDKWKAIDPVHPFKFQFYDDQLVKVNQWMDDLVAVIGFIAFLAIIIACLSLFGLAAFTAEQRTKEIGIRKVLGASVAGIVSLLSKNFVGTVALSFLLASPLAWYTMNQWLQDFDYRIDIAWWMFAVSGRERRTGSQ